MTRKVSRRRYVQALGAASVATLAGCSSAPGGGSDGSDGGETTESTETETTTTESTESATTTESTETASDREAYSADVEPHGNMHIHGQLTFEINDTTYEIGDLPYNWEKDTAESTGTGDTHWHFHGDDDSATKFHVHSEDVTLGYGLNTLPKVDAAADWLAFRGTTYDASNPETTLKYMVDGEERSLDYVFEDSGAVVKVVVESDKEAPETVTPSTTLTPGEQTSNSTSTNSTSTTTTESDF